MRVLIFICGMILLVSAIVHVLFIAEDGTYVYKGDLKCNITQENKNTGFFYHNFEFSPEDEMTSTFVEFSNGQKCLIVINKYKEFK
jgi:hypothetical protein